MDEDWRDKGSPEFDQPTSQALAAQEVLFLYTWWKHERPRLNISHDAVFMVAGKGVVHQKVTHMLSLMVKQRLKLKH